MSPYLAPWKLLYKCLDEAIYFVGGNLVEELVGHGMTGLGGKPDSPLGSPPHGGAEAMDCDG
jgi:hypothetical protein